MASTPVAVPNRRYLRRAKLEGAFSRGTVRGRLSKFKAWLTARALVFAGTGASAPITVAVTDIITLAGHGQVSGNGPFVMITDGTLPTGLAVDTQYFVGVIDANTFYFHRTSKDAVNDTNRVDITDTGSGTHSLRADERSESVVTLMKQGVSTTRLQGSADIDDFV